jgi:predicted RNA binding protein YcfA (HicA-like mRNA interferase family)
MMTIRLTILLRSPIDPKDIIRVLESKGFVLKRIKGSHHIFQHSVNKKITVVPVHKKDLPIGTFLAIIKQAGLRKDEL